MMDLRVELQKREEGSSVRLLCEISMLCKYNLPTHAPNEVSWFLHTGRSLSSHILLRSGSMINLFWLRSIVVSLCKLPKSSGKEISWLLFRLSQVSSVRL